MALPRKTRFVKQFLFFYLLALTMPLLMGVIIYLITYNLEYRRVERANADMLVHGMEKLRDGLMDAERLSVQLLTDEELIDLAGTEDLFSSEHIYGATNFLKKNSLIPKALLSKLFFGYFILEESGRYVFSQDQATPLKSFYTYDYRIRDRDFGEFLSLLEQIGTSGFYPRYPLENVGNSRDFYYPYFHIYGKTPGERRIVMVLLNRDVVRFYLAPLDTGETGNALRLEYNGAPLIDEIDPPPTAEQRDILREGKAMIRSGENYLSVAHYQNWTCYLLQPAGAVAANIRYIPKLILFMIAGILLLGFLFMLLLAYQTSRPVLNLIEKIRQDKDQTGTGTGTDALTTLDFFVEQLKGRNHQLEELIAEQKTKLKTNFLISLLYDTFPNPSQIPTMARHAGVMLTDEAVLTVVLQLQSEETALGEEWEHLFPISLVSLQNRIYRIFGSRVYIIQINLNQICLLASFSGPGQNGQKGKLIESLREWVRTELQETYVMGVSRFHRGWAEVPRSFREARAALIYNWPHNDDSINEYQESADTAGGDGEVYFPRETDHVILDAIRTGRTRDLKECLTRINRENLELRKLEPFAQNILIARYQEILAHVLSSLKIGDNSLAERLNGLIRRPGDHLALFLTSADDVLMELCDYFYSDQTRKELDMARQIKSYLEENFQDNQLNLIMTAEHHGLSSQYLTRIVKKYYGKTFRNFMEDLRMDYVRKLILESDTPIHLLIEKGGYNSMNTFCKAFKRKYGYNASSLRE